MEPFDKDAHIQVLWQDFYPLLQHALHQQQSRLAEYQEYQHRIPDYNLVREATGSFFPTLPRAEEAGNKQEEEPDDSWWEAEMQHLWSHEQVLQPLAPKRLPEEKTPRATLEEHLEQFCGSLCDGYFYEGDEEPHAHNEQARLKALWHAFQEQLERPYELRPLSDEEWEAYQHHMQKEESVSCPCCHQQKALPPLAPEVCAPLAEQEERLTVRWGLYERFKTAEKKQWMGGKEE